MAPLTRQRKKALAAAAGVAVPLIGTGGRLSALPDDVLRRILGFLPAQDAVRTCVLGWQWRDLWKSASGLRIWCDGEGEKSVEDISEFVHELLLARGSSALEACELRVFDFDEDDVPNVNSWIRYVVMRSVQVLWLNFYRHSNHIDPWFHLDDLPLVSQHLTRLQLSVLQLNDSFLDFSSCSVLEDLEIDYCELSSVNRISSQSLKSLSIISQCSFGYTSRTQIYVPNLISLWMEVGFGRTPVLERMPSLMEAVVKIDSCYDSCGDGDGSGDCDIEDCEVCYGIDGDADNCVVLQSLSEAKDLVLLTNAETFIFRRDLKWCPTFSNLKTLLLDEYWCVPGDLSALACILQHSPVLEKLTLQLFCKGPKSKVEIKGSPDPTERSSAICEHLKIVEIKCEVLDEGVQNALKFLTKLNIYSYTFHFEQ